MAEQIRYGPGFQHGAAPDPELPVNKGRIVNNKMLFGPGSPVFADLHHGFLYQAAGKFPRVGNGGGAKNKNRRRAVKAANSFQAPQDIGKVAAKNSPVLMYLVNYNILQVLKKFNPLGMVRQYSGMKHIRVGNNNMAAVPDLQPQARFRVPVICKARKSSPASGELPQFGRLVPKGLWLEIEGAAVEF